MKKIVALILLSAIGIHLNAQDMLILRTGEKQSVVIKKVGLNTIEYVRFDSQRRPVYEVNKEDVHKIIYKNGVEDTFQPLNRIDITPIDMSIKNGVFLDGRDSISYKYTIIGKQVWMAENLKCPPGRTFTIEDNIGLCKECGRYYTYEEALEACPNGWHLPTDRDWIELEIFAGMSDIEAAKSGWRGTDPGQASDLLKGGKSGLELLMCGNISTYVSDKKIYSKADINYFQEEAFYWTATESLRSYAYYRHFTGRASIERESYLKGSRFPIRCVKD
jgi:uncharacterized protein (TIGR02145 family)